MMGHCPTCDTTQELRVITKNETYPVKGEDITIEARVAVCGTCGTEVFVRELDFDNLERAYRIYREKHNIVSPDDVRRLREKTGLSQREFAKRLGWSPATVNRYEKGALPSPAHNTVLRRLMQPEGFREFIGGYRRGDSEESFVSKTWLDELLSFEPGIENGFRRFALEKLFNMIIFFTTNNPLSKTALMKYLWYADFKYFRDNSVSISGALYVALPHGPALHKWERILQEAQELGYINVSAEYLGDFEVETLEAARDFDESMFTLTEIEIMQEVKEAFRGRTARELSNMSHKETAWKNTPPGNLISYQYAFDMH